MTLPIVLPHPQDMARRWAVVSAVLSARGPRWADGAHATSDTWHYDDGGGNWADLRLLGDGRAVLVGHDHEYSDTYYGAGAEYFGEEETDLLAGAPDWWVSAISDHLDRVATQGMWIGFVYGFDGAKWSRAEYEPDDGFTALNPPFLSDEAAVDFCTEHLDGYAEDDGLSVSVDVAALARALAEGAGLARETAASVFAGRGLDVDAALAAAHRFAH
ncbi:hypothetical protein [Rhodococcus gannanensis]|uniref:Proteophosphoglycan 5 n=1 Tax=Rhodococcus gannanensis TaxID=1960308 RepID=A0ABW4P2Q0_9NOCA